MNSDDQFWLGMWKIGGVVACVGFLTIGSCSSYRTYATKEAILNGADAIDATCAFAVTPDRGICSIRAAKHEAKT